MRVVARVFNAGLFPARDVPVSLALEGMKPLEQTITVEGRTRRTRPLRRAARQASAFIPDSSLVKGGDELPFDDRRYFRLRDATGGTRLARRRRARPVGFRQ